LLLNFYRNVPTRCQLSEKTVGLMSDIEKSSCDSKYKQRTSPDSVYSSYGYRKSAFSGSDAKYSMKADSGFESSPEGKQPTRWLKMDVNLMHTDIISFIRNGLPELKSQKVAALRSKSFIAQSHFTDVLLNIDHRGFTATNLAALVIDSNM
jgi:hypothetical protein